MRICSRIIDKCKKKKMPLSCRKNGGGGGESNNKKDHNAGKIARCLLIERKDEIEEGRSGVVYKNNFSPYSHSFQYAKNIIVEKLKIRQNLWQNVRQKCESFHLILLHRRFRLMFPSYLFVYSLSFFSSKFSFVCRFDRPKSPITAKVIAF